MPHCWKSHVRAHKCLVEIRSCLPVGVVFALIRLVLLDVLVGKVVEVEVFFGVVAVVVVVG